MEWFCNFCYIHKFMALIKGDQETKNTHKLPVTHSMHIGWLYFLDKNYFIEESDYLNGKIPDKTEPQISLRTN